MNILHVTPTFYPAHFYGGPIQSVYDLCRHITAHAHQVRVLTTNSNGPGKVLYPRTTVTRLEGDVEVTYCRKLASESVSISLAGLLPQYANWADVIHLTSVYSFPTIPTLLAARVLEKPVVWSPRGSLQRWSGSTKVTLKKVWNRTCRTISSGRVVLHVTSTEEAAESEQAYPKASFTIIPNGVALPEIVNRQEDETMMRLLFLGRLHPKKGIENLLAACSQLGSAWSWNLTIAGDGIPGYIASLRALIDQLGLSDRVRMAGQVTGEAKQRLFEQSDILIAPSYTENFCMVVAEALAHEVPVIVSHGCPWQAVETRGCGIWVANDPDTLFNSISDLRQRPLREMGRRGRAWMMRDFGWDKRAAQMIAVYRDLVHPAQDRHATYDAVSRSVLR